MDYLNSAKKLLDYTKEIRRYLHQNAEIGFVLPKTVEYVKAKLGELSLFAVDNCECGFYVDIEGDNPGKTLLIRADMDALPMPEENDLPFRSVTGNAHACGHDLHTAILVAAAKLLSENKDKIYGRVRLMFQPAEEVIEGAQVMIENGVLDGVDTVLGYHTELAKSNKTGVVEITKGPFLASSDIWKIEVFGKGGHGSAPELSIDVINIACGIHTALGEIVSREVASQDPIVLTVGKLSAGTAANILPEIATIEGTLRTLNNETRAFVLKRIEEIACGIAKTYRGEAKFTLMSGTPPTINDKYLAGKFLEYAKMAVGEDMTVTDALPAMASDDFAYLSNERPGVMYHISFGGLEEGYTSGIHNPKAVFNEEGIVNGLASLMAITIEYLKEHR